MKLLELEIQNVRGIRYLLIKPEGANVVVWGPNGSGKSAVVDAVDFLLTGRVTRLTGKGTKGLTLIKHGPHIDQKPDTAIVRAVLQLPGIEKPIEIKRCMANPDNFECDPAIAPRLRPIMALAYRGQHVLTRREILKYITAEASTRAQEIQELLNVTEIEDIRKTLVKVQNDFEKELAGAKHAVDAAKSTINATIQEKFFQQDAILRFINQIRTVLNGQPITTLRAAELKAGLTPPSVVVKDKAINTNLLERDVQNLIDATAERNKVQVSQIDEQLRTLVANVRADPQSLHALSHLKLTELGITLVDESGQCPLCDTPWPPGQLQAHLEYRLSLARAAIELQERINSLSRTISNAVSSYSVNLQRVISVAQMASLDEDARQLQSWFANLQYLSEVLSAPIDRYHGLRFSSGQVGQMLAPVDASDVLGRVRTGVKAKYPESTPEQNAWDILTRLEENLKALESAEAIYNSVAAALRKATILLDSFQKARDTILGKLYEEIKDHFVTLYRHLHGPDEDKFTAKIEPEGAGLNFEVDFYGRGAHPPHALHSEGHQDSMGLCLYLALAERLTGGLIDLIILDDVVMSVDADHRRQLCNLLATFFPNRQFLITTHDKTWATQLRSEGVINSQKAIEFYNWSIDTGPHVNIEIDMWERLDVDLRGNDIPSAAARLRRGSEEFFAAVCDSECVNRLRQLGQEFRVES